MQKNLSNGPSPILESPQRCWFSRFRPAAARLYQSFSRRIFCGRERGSKLVSFDRVDKTRSIPLRSDATSRKSSIITKNKPVSMIEIILFPLKVLLIVIDLTVRAFIDLLLLSLLSHTTRNQPKNDRSLCSRSDGSRQSPKPSPANQSVLFLLIQILLIVWILNSKEFSFSNPPLPEERRSTNWPFTRLNATDQETPWDRDHS